MNLSVCTTARAGLLLSLGCLSLMALAGPRSSTKDAEHLRAIRESGFTENKGQWDSRALFMMSRPGKDVWVTKNGFVVDLYRIDHAQDGVEGESEYRRGHVVQFELEGANAAATPIGSSAVPTRVDYLMGGDSSRVVSTSIYKEAYVAGVYRNVDLRAYKDGGDFRYDLVARPGADVSQIRFSIKGSDRVRLDDKGGLVIETSLGAVSQSAPVVYQQVGKERVMVDAKFTVSGSRVGFQVGKHNRSLPLVIDPLVYGSYVGADNRGGNSDDVVYDGVADANGNLYMTGYTLSTNFPILNGPYGFNNRGARDAFLVRMAADAYALDYAAYIGGTGRDEARAIGLSDNGQVLWIGGTTSSASFPGSINPTAFSDQQALDPTFASFWFMRIAVTSTGVVTPVASRYFVDMGKASFANTRLGLLGLPYPTPVDPTEAWFGGMAVTANGTMFFVGDSPNIPAAVTNFTSSANPGGRDGFIASFDTGLNPTRIRRLGTTFNDRMGGVAAAPDGGVVLTMTVGGATNQDTSNPGSDPLIWPTTPGVFPNGRLLRRTDVAVVRFRPNLTLTYSALVGGASNDEAVDVAVDPTGAAYLLSYSGSFDFPRTRGVFDAVNEAFGEDVVTKISPTASSIEYSTGLRHSGEVYGRRIAADARGVAFITGLVGFEYPGGTPPQAMRPGSIPTTPDALRPAYEGGNDSVFPNNRVDVTNTTGFRATYDSFIQVLNPAASGLLYSSYIGGGGDDEAWNVVVDRVGAAWILGHTQVARNASGGAKGPTGLPSYITANAFKSTVDAVQGESRDGFAIKLRVGLPRMTALTVSQAQVAGGLGASTTGTITLGGPAPAGGVVINLSLSNPGVSSFSPTGGVSQQSVVVPAGATTATFPIYSLPVVVPANTTLRATLDNDFLVTEITVNPWLSEMTTTPGLLVGGNQINLIVRLFQNATQEIRIPITTSDNSLVVPPSNNEIIVPAGANTASVLLNTGGVESTTAVNVSGSLLGVVRPTTVTLTRAELTAVSFNPNRILGGESTQMTMTFNGRVGADREITIAQTGGVAVTFPSPVTILAQQNSRTVTVTAPVVTTNQSATLAATCVGFTASQTLFIDPIDILNIQVQPAATVLGGTVVTGVVNLTRPAGQNDLAITIANSNATAGTLNTTTVTVPAGQSQSGQFTFTTNIVGATQVATLSASRAGFTTRSVDITVQAIPVFLTVSPGSVLGGSENATASVSIGTPAPAGGLTLALASDNAAVTVSPSTVTIAAGATAPAAGTVISLTTTKVAVDTPTLITATLSPFAVGSATLNVRAPRVIGLTLTPSQVSGGSGSTGRVTVETEAPDGGMVISLFASNAASTVPATVTIPGGATSATFPITTTPVSTPQLSIITAQGSSSVATADLQIEAASVGRVTFNPNIVRGGAGSTATVTLNNPAPAGGLTLTIASDAPAFAQATVASITIPAGQRTGTFQVTTNRTSRRLNIGFTVTITATGTTGRGFLGITP